MRNLVRFLATIISVVTLAVMGTAIYYEQSLADHYYVRQGEKFEVGTAITAESNPVVIPVSQTGQDQLVQLNLFGIIPIKQTRVSEVDTMSVVVGGTPFGIKLLTDGVLVVGLNSIDTNDGLKNPAKQAGLRVGDIITAVDGKKVSSNREISTCVNNCGSEGIVVSYYRDNQACSATVYPVTSRVDGKQKAGIWVRDSSAGIGTVTFYDPNTQTFGGLGHGVTDVDTGGILPLSYGEVVSATITGYNKGAPGYPGQLLGSFSSTQPIGSVLKNTEAGVYGDWYNIDTNAQTIKIALKQEVHTGSATILTTLSGSQPEEFSIEIEDIDTDSEHATRNMVIKVTDENLLQQTGGIIQGMSGSPIIQDGKLVGAVTHVFVNDPTKGYGIFAESMYATMLSEETTEQLAA